MPSIHSAPGGTDDGPNKPVSDGTGVPPCANQSGPLTHSPLSDIEQSPPLSRVKAAALAGLLRAAARFAPSTGVTVETSEAVDRFIRSSPSRKLIRETIDTLEKTELCSTSVVEMIEIATALSVYGLKDRAVVPGMLEVLTRARLRLRDEFGSISAEHQGEIFQETAALLNKNKVELTVLDSWMSLSVRTPVDRLQDAQGLISDIALACSPRLVGRTARALLGAIPESRADLQEIAEQWLLIAEQAAGIGLRYESLGPALIKATGRLLRSGIIDNQFGAALHRHVLMNSRIADIDFYCAIRVAVQTLPGFDQYRHSSTLIEQVSPIPSYCKQWFVDSVRAKTTVAGLEALSLLSKIYIDHVSADESEYRYPPLIDQDKERLRESAVSMLKQGELPYYRLYLSALLLRRVLHEGRKEEVQSLLQKATDYSAGNSNGLTYLEGHLTVKYPPAGYEPEAPRERPLLAELFDALYDRGFKDGIATATLGRLGSALHQRFPVQYAENILAALKGAPSPYTTDEIFRAVFDASLHGSTDFMASGILRHDYEKVGVLHRMAQTIGSEVLIGNDIPPGIQLRARDAFSAVRRLRSFHAGFTALAADAERSHSIDGRSNIERMADLIGSRVNIRDTSEDGRAAHGTLISGIDPARVFAPDPERPDDPFHRYKEQWPHIGDTIDYLKKVDHGFLRRCLLIDVPVDPQMGLDYRMPDGSTKRIQYAIVPANDHFESLVDVAFLVDSSVLRQRLAPCLYDPDLQDAEQVRSFRESGLTALELRRLARENPLACLEIGSSANIVGGFIHSIAPNAPHFDGLEETNSSLLNRTEFGHPDFLSPSPPPTFSELINQVNLIQYSQYIHNQILGITERGLAYLELSMIVLSQSNKGYIDERAEIGNIDSDGDQPGYMRSQSDDFTDQHNPDIGLMRLLYEARRRREHALSRQLPPEEFRVLVSCDTVHLASRPNAEIRLDTLTGVLQVGMKEYLLDLDSDDITDRDREIWNTIVVPKLAPYFTAMRFFKHEQLGS